MTKAVLVTAFVTALLVGAFLSRGGAEDVDPCAGVSCELDRVAVVHRDRCVCAVPVVHIRTYGDVL